MIHVYIVFLTCIIFFILDRKDGEPEGFDAMIAYDEDVDLT